MKMDGTRSRTKKIYMCERISFQEALKNTIGGEFEFIDNRYYEGKEDILMAGIVIHVNYHDGDNQFSEMSQDNSIFTRLINRSDVDEIIWLADPETNYLHAVFAYREFFGEIPKKEYIAFGRVRNLYNFEIREKVDIDEFLKGGAYGNFNRFLGS